MPKSNEYVYVILPKGTEAPVGYSKSKNVGEGVTYRKKISGDLFSALDDKKMIKSNISKSRGGKRTKKSKRSRKHGTRKHRTSKH